MNFRGLRSEVGILKTESRRQKFTPTSDLRPPTSEHGFSLIELMLTVSFVMLGAILLQGSYMRSAEIFGRYTHSLQSMVWMEEQVSKAKENLLFSSEDAPSESGVIQDGGKVIHWSREVHPAAGSNLYSIGIKLSWKEGPKSIEMEGEQYVYKKPSTAL